MEIVYMRHPKVDGPPAEVPRSAVPHWSGGGWEECEPPPARVRPSRDQSDQQNTTSTRTERRRTTRSSKED